MSDPNTSLPPAGWYPDPQRPGASRWWTGSDWAPPSPATITPAKPASNGFAIAGFIVSIVAAGSFIASNQATAIAVVGLILSVFGVNNARNRDGVGLQLGWWGVGISLAGLIFAQLWRLITS
ncbi:DUF2510 domain-containing protein [Agromyces humi]|uniref:DUF2510 domain-containing protein n=1 Tax=Agromyces humi TaxID=1766800 RepID=UPI00135870A1|nr:DUF2510 domain-containing protein [Agromyces humi]